MQLSLAVPRRPTEVAAVALSPPHLCSPQRRGGQRHSPVVPQASDFPVILSLENHCSMEQQEVLAQQLKDILGEQLLTATTDGRVPTQLPSPEVMGRAG